MRKKRWFLDEYKEDIINKYFNENLTCKEIAEIYNTNKDNISNFLKKRCGLKLKKKAWNKKINLDEEYIVEQYNLGRDGIDISKELGVSTPLIYRTLEANGVTRRLQVYEVDHNFFGSWSEDMAYILGFVTADGNVPGNKPYLRVELKRADKQILEYIKKCLSPDSKIYDYEHIDKRRNVTSYSSLFCLYSNQIVNDLKKYNVFPNKTGKHLLDFNIPEEYLHSYTRGFFDADGSIYPNKYGSMYSTITCMCQQFLEELRLRNKLSLGKIAKGCGNNKNLFNWDMNIKDTQIFGEFIYQSYNFALERKRDRFYAKSSSLRS